MPKLASEKVTLIPDQFMSLKRDIGWTLDMAGVADRIADRFGNPDGLFALLQPTGVLKYLTERVIKAHMVEIALRFQKEEDTRPGTAAEVLAGMLGASTIAPLNSTALALCERLSKVVMKYEPGSPIGRESYKGQMKECFTEAQRKLTQTWRKRG